MNKQYSAIVLAAIFFWNTLPELHAQKETGDLLHPQRTSELPAWTQQAMRGGVANDECAGAVMLTVGASCVPYAATYAGATESMDAVTCGIFTASVANDVWFSFVATSEGTMIEVNGAPSTDPIIQVFSGTCGSLTGLGCADATFVGGTETVSIATTIGQTYFFRTYYWPYFDPPADFNFTACVYAAAPPPPPPPPPANNVCADAIMLTPNVECVYIAGNWTAATQSLEPATCNTYTATVAHDTWYGFTATTSISTIYVQGVTGNDPVLQLFSGTCGSLATLDCRDHTFGGGLETLQYNTVPGTTYYFRTYYWYTGTTPTAMEYTTCVVEGAGTLGMKETAMDEWRVFPNPNTGAFTLMNADMSGKFDLRLIDLGGRTVYSSQLAITGGGRHEIDLGGGIATGSYVLHIIGDGHSHVQRMVIDR